VGYATRAAMSSVRRANVRQRRREEFARLHAREHLAQPVSLPIDHQMVAQEQSSSSR
jgi:hypothetical protein